MAGAGGLGSLRGDLLTLIQIIGGSMVPDNNGDVVYNGLLGPGRMKILFSVSVNVNESHSRDGAGKG